MEYTIYALRCPESGKIRYVGCTGKPIIRERNHCRHLINNPKTPVQRWIIAIRQRGMHPIFEVLETGRGAFLNEALWIRRLRMDGHPLLNVIHNQDK